MKNKILIVLGIITLLGLIFLNLGIVKIYEKNIYKTYARITTYVSNIYPEEEVNIIKMLEEERDDSTLKKYGIEEDNISSLKEIKNNKIKIIILTSSSYCFLIAFIILFYLKYRHKLSKEILTINSYLLEILNGNYEINIADYKENEISILKNDIYKVAIKLKELSLYEKREKVFLMETLEDISHQLKTPLTALTINNDILKSNDLTVKERQEFLRKQERELARIEWLITTLLKVSKLNSGEVKLKKDKVSASILIVDALEPLLIPLELKSANVLKENLDFNISCDKNWTIEALTNILKNACEHIKLNGEITIIGDDNPLYASISIKDNGEGISKKEIKNVFKRFYSTNSNNNFGIGLHMAKVIMEHQNGEIEVTSEKGKYTYFKVIFKKKKY